VISLLFLLCYLWLLIYISERWVVNLTTRKTGASILQFSRHGTLVLQAYNGTYIPLPTVTSTAGFDSTEKVFIQAPLDLRTTRDIMLNKTKVKSTIINTTTIAFCPLSMDAGLQ
jgi:hypothetical protein